MAYDHKTSPTHLHPMFCSWCGERQHTREVQSQFDTASFVFRCEKCQSIQEVIVRVSPYPMQQMYYRSPAYPNGPMYPLDSSSIGTIEMNQLGRYVEHKHSASPAKDALAAKDWENDPFIVERKV
jgi:hypothetical protein